MADESFEAKLLKEIDKTGFPLELRVSRFLDDNGYLIANSLYFIDQDEGKGREIDIRALRNFIIKRNGNEFFVRHCFFFECKKSQNKPWIIFTTPKTFYDEALFMAHARGIRKDQSWHEQEIGHEASKIHYYASFERRGRSFFEAFGNNEREMIFKSLVTVTKATIAARNNNFAAGDNSICIYYPVVVFEGKLYEAYLDNEKIALKEANTILVSFYYESTKYTNERFAIPIVNAQYLRVFLPLMDRALQFFGELFKANMHWFSMK